MKLLKRVEEFTDRGNSIGVMSTYECSLDEAIRECDVRGLGIVHYDSERLYCLAQCCDITTADGEYAGAYASYGRSGHLYLWEKD